VGRCTFLSFPHAPLLSPRVIARNEAISPYANQCPRIFLGRYLRPVLYAHTAQALFTWPVSAAITNAFVRTLYLRVSLQERSNRELCIAALYSMRLPHCVRNDIGGFSVRPLLGLNSMDVGGQMVYLFMEFYVMNDQPTTCPICSARTDTISDLYHTNLRLLINECLDIECKHVFLEVEPEL